MSGIPSGDGGRARARVALVLSFSAEAGGGMLKPPQPFGKQTLGLDTRLKFLCLKCECVTSSTPPGVQCHLTLLLEPTLSQGHRMHP